MSLMCFRSLTHTDLNVSFLLWNILFGKLANYGESVFWLVVWNICYFPIQLGMSSSHQPGFLWLGKSTTQLAISNRYGFFRQRGPRGFKPIHVIDPYKLECRLQHYAYIMVCYIHIYIYNIHVYIFVIIYIYVYTCSP